MRSTPRAAYDMCHAMLTQVELRSRRARWALSLTLSPIACGGEREPRASDAGLESAADDPTLSFLPRGDDQLRSLCAHDGDDPIRSFFCADAPLELESIVDLSTARFIDEARLTGINGLAIAGHSSSRGGRSISSINPRVIFRAHRDPLYDENDNPVAPGSQGTIAPAIEPVAIAFRAANSTSSTWQMGYDAVRRGEAITFPHHDVRVTDASKLARATEAYQAYRNGELDRSQLPDIRDVFPDDPQRLAAMGFATKAGASGEDVLLEACSMCHNDRLDPSLSRARFRADLTGMRRAEKDIASGRLRLPRNDLHAMPLLRARAG
jgi:hypothetical protein